MATHKIQLTFDEARAGVRLRHFAIVDIAGHAVTVHEDVPLTDEQKAALAGYLTGLIDPNRKAMDELAAQMGIDHVAAVNKRTPRKGVKHIHLEGSIVPEGTLASDTKG